MAFHYVAVGHDSTVCLTMGGGGFSGDCNRSVLSLPLTIILRYPQMRLHPVLLPSIAIVPWRLGRHILALTIQASHLR